MNTAPKDNVALNDRKRIAERHRLDEIKARRICDRYTDDADVDWMIERLAAGLDQEAA